MRTAKTLIRLGARHFVGFVIRRLINISWCVMTFHNGLIHFQLNQVGGAKADQQEHQPGQPRAVH